MRASIAAVVSALLWITPASADRTFQGFSEDLSNRFQSGTGVSAGTATISIHRGAGGQVTDITISDTNGALVKTGSANAAAGFVADPLTRFIFAPQGWAIASYLDFSSFGTWLSPGPNAIIAGAVAGGRPTPAPAMPRTGTATYQGKTFGVGEVDAGSFLREPILIWGDASITADFSHLQVVTDLTNLMSSATAVGSGVGPGFNPVGPATPLGSLSGTANLSGNTYSGALHGTFAALGTQVTVAGPEQGRFFGPKALETAGTWAVSGVFSFPATFTGTGSFGAVRKP